MKELARWKHISNESVQALLNWILEYNDRKNSTTPSSINVVMRDSAKPKPTVRANSALSAEVGRLLDVKHH